MFTQAPEQLEPQLLEQLEPQLEHPEPVELLAQVVVQLLLQEEGLFPPSVIALIGIAISVMSSVLSCNAQLPD